MRYNLPRMNSSERLAPNPTAPEADTSFPVIEKANKGDMETIVQIVRKQWPQFTDDDHEFRDLWLVAIAGGNIVGVASFTREQESGYVFLQDIVVTMPHRRHGIGKQLIEQGIDTFLTEDETLIALVSTINKPAIDFYRALPGFEKLTAKAVKAKSRVAGKPQNKTCMAWGYTK